jgi:hypothetical protein
VLYFLLIWVIVFFVWDFQVLRIPNWRNNAALMGLAAIIAVVPTVLWLRSLIELAQQGNQLVYAYPKLPGYWLEVFGPGAILVILGIWVSLGSLRRRSIRTNLDIFLLVWSASSLFLASLAYLFPSFPIAFSDRSLLLLPVPLLAARAVVWILDQTSSKMHPSVYAFGVLLILIPAATAPIVFSYTAPSHFVEYIRPSTYSELTWLSANYKPEQAPIFVFSFPSQCAFLWTALYNNWVNATFGSHDSYFGALSYLLNGRQTPFSDQQSATLSNLQTQNLASNGLIRNGRLLDDDIVLLTQFNPAYPPNEFSSVLKQLHPGIWVYNGTQATSSGVFSSPLVLNSSASCKVA